MRLQKLTSARTSLAIGVGLVLALSSASIAWVHGHDSARSSVQAQSKLEATIFSYDGQDFVRVKTTLLTEDGKSAVNTKLDRESAAYKALTQKRSYTGEATLFGRSYDSNYAPLTNADGQLTGAIFVASPK